MVRERTVVASRWVKVGGRRRVGQVVGGDINGLNRGDGARLGGGDALLQVAHLGGQRGLVTNGGGHTAQQCGNLGAGLRETEDVVDEQQHVLAASSRKYSAMVRPDRPTRRRAPGGSFIWP